MSESGYRIRVAVRDDCPQILNLVQELLTEIKLATSLVMTAAQLAEDGFPRHGPPAFTCHVAEPRDAPGQLVGICLHYVTYSAHVGRTAYLEDLYVVPAYRGHRLGARLMAALADWARSHRCSRINFTLPDGNAMVRRFYWQLGAVDLTADGWHLHRITGDALSRLGDLYRPEGDEL
ncbi:Diamine acetyltransferase 2 [Amphibalanus amphitrite]|uniref:Diamine acetyltransferase 2 n=1 Tax=Amphibalanus amphitrite TaxID=1232801 RepID=A0A6A4W9T3_AMPAM|nr:Diamine acetyltransferase 2 [Amphibalanus amphitrite]